MGGHCHKYLGRVKFFGSFGSQKGAKHAIFVQGRPLMVGLNYPVSKFSGKSESLSIIYT